MPEKFHCTVCDKVIPRESVRISEMSFRDGRNSWRGDLVNYLTNKIMRVELCQECLERLLRRK